MIRTLPYFLFYDELTVSNKYFSKKVYLDEKYN